MALYSDQIVNKTLACPSIDILKKAPLKDSDSMDLSLFVIVNGCEILTRRDSVQAIGYDPLNAKELYVKIVYKKTGDYLYVPSSDITIEQDGKKAIYRF
jgi:hypothetical protein